jgi:hypothetical protein
MTEKGFIFKFSFEKVSDVGNSCGPGRLNHLCRLEYVGDVGTVVASVVYINCLGWSRLGMWGQLWPRSFISTV